MARQDRTGARQPGEDPAEVTLASVLGRLAGELADLRTLHAAETRTRERLEADLSAALAREAALGAALASAEAREEAARLAHAAEALSLREAITARDRQLAAERSAAHARLLDAERLLQRLERRLGQGWSLLGRARADEPVLPPSSGEAPILALALGLGRRAARRVAATVARQAQALGGTALLVSDEAGLVTGETTPVRVLRLPALRALAPELRDAYRAGRLRLLAELWQPMQIVPFGPEAVRLLNPDEAEAAQAASAGAATARS